jgi:putative membrane protein
MSWQPVPTVPELSWRRLSPRMLLIHPVREVGRALPALAGLLIAGSGSGHEWWSLLGLVLVMALSLLRWFTTRYQITAQQVQLRTGLLRRRTITTPIDRVRTVDVTAHALHRLLGLAKVAIGTGISDRKREGLVLDGLTARAAGALRAELLHRAAQPADPVAPLGNPLAGRMQPSELAANRLAQPAHPGDWQAQPAEQLLARLDLRWVRYAPFTLSGVVTALAIVGLAWRIINQANIQADRLSFVRSVSRHFQSTTPWLDAVQAAIAALVFVTLLSVVGYLLAFWNYRLTRHPGGSLHVSRGLITARATSIAERRLRGVELSQLLPLRAVGGARLLAVATGLRVGRGAERGGTLLMPACPVEQARRVAAAVLNDATLPIRPVLRRHAPAARRRRYLRTVAPATALWLVLFGWWLAGGMPGWLPALGILLPVLAALLAEDRYAGLGHALAGRYLIARSGSLNRRQVLLQTDGIIGWNLRQSYFQRRARLATLTATTAAGQQEYRVIDLAAADALRLADAALPGLLEEFLVRTGPAEPAE